MKLRVAIYDGDKLLEEFFVLSDVTFDDASRTLASAVHMVIADNFNVWTDTTEARQ